MQTYYQKNKEHCLEYRKQYYQENKEKIKAYNAMYFQKKTKLVRASKPKKLRPAKERKVPVKKERIFVAPAPIEPPPLSLSTITIRPGFLLDWNAL